MLAIALVAAFAPAALAGNSTVYQGKFPDVPGSSATLKTVDKNDGLTYFKSFVARDIVADCGGNVELKLDNAFARGLSPLGRRGGFRVKGSEGGETIKVKGKVKNSGKAKGTFRFTSTENVNGQQVECDTGRLAWKARA